ncbi:FAD-dependent oxidoreductase [Kaarinaea lacus]
MPLCRESYDALIIGGGFFGMYLAEHMARAGKTVLLCEKESAFMQRASLINQARVHNGYHYPRSLLTAFRSRASFSRFVAEFDECIEDSFASYYAIGKVLSKVTANQFEQFCRRIGASCEPAPYRISRLMSSNLIDQVYLTREYAFDAVRLQELMKSRLDSADVECQLNVRVHSVRYDSGLLHANLKIQKPEVEECSVTARQVFNCAYSMTNKVLIESSLDIIPLKHELAEICLVEAPPELANIAITVMCGPFFSVMPFPVKNLHSFSHVRYTPHYAWYDRDYDSYHDAHELLNVSEKRSSWQSMIHDAQRYLPILSQCHFRESLWEVKTVLPRSEIDDSRPILFRPDHGLPGFHCVMGGKIDNVYDAVEVIQKLGLDK